MKTRLMSIAALACFLVLGSVAGFASSANQIAFSKTPITVNGGCCPNIPGEAVSINEPSTVAPVVLVWSMEFNSTGPFAFGVSLNGGGCGEYGPTDLGEFKLAPPVTYEAKTMQMIILPQDGLKVGTNTFNICTDSLANPGDTMTLGTRTLFVRFAK
jgi:hypothetical protein